MQGRVTVTESRSVGARLDHNREDGIEPKFGIMVPNHNFTDYNRKRREERNEVSSRWVGASLYGSLGYYRGTIVVVLTNLNPLPTNDA